LAADAFASVATAGHDVGILTTSSAGNTNHETRHAELVPIEPLDVSVQTWRSGSGRMIDNGIVGDVRTLVFSTRRFREFRSDDVVHFRRAAAPARTR